MSSPVSGFNALFFMRADWQDIAHRQNETKTEFIWAPSPTLGLAQGATYAGILYGGYCTVDGLSMSIYSNDTPIMDDERLEDYNVPAIVDRLVSIALDALKSVPQGGAGADGTRDIMLPLGCDFEWEAAGTWFTNTDRIIHHANINGTVNAFYSTPAIYAAAKLESGRAYSLTNGSDLFPYDFFPHGYLTGFFTSRPALKGYIRETSSVFHAAKQLQALTAPPADASLPSNALYRLERALGVTQHHDAVTGSSKQAVAYDYARRLAWGREDADELVSASLAALTGFGNASSWASCDLANATICPALERGEAVAILVYNQQAHAAAAGASSAANVRLAVGLPPGVVSYAVFDSAAAPVVAQLLPPSAADVALRDKYYNASVNASAANVHWLAFQCARLPPVGFSVFFLVPAASAEAAPLTHVSVPRVVALAAAAADVASTNGVVTLSFDGDTGLLSHFSSARSGLSQPLTQALGFYNSSAGTHIGDPGISGAYIFRPNSSTLFPIAWGTNESLMLSVVEGPVVNETRQVFAAAWASQVVRLWASAGNVELELTVGPIPISFNDTKGREVVSRITAPALSTNKTFFTDSNMRDSMKRILDYRPTWNLTVEESVSGNYYPVPSFIFTSDVSSGVTLSVATDRAQGGSSLADGSLELMLHRRLHYDDALGVGEVLNETGLNAAGAGLVIRTTHLVSLEASPAAAARARRAAVADQAWRPLVRAVPLGALSPPQWAASFRASFSALTAELPPQLHLLTAHAWSPSRLLLRISHSFEAGEDAGGLSAPASVDLTSIFAPASNVTLSACEETTLWVASRARLCAPPLKVGEARALTHALPPPPPFRSTAHQPLASAPSWTYTVENGGPTVTLPFVYAPPSGPAQTVTLEALQIRTFLCGYALGA